MGFPQMHCDDDKFYCNISNHVISENPTGSEKTSKVFAQITICHLVFFAARFNVATRRVLGYFTASATVVVTKYFKIFQNTSKYFKIFQNFKIFHRLDHRGGDKTTIYEGGGKAGGKSSTGKGKAGEGKGRLVGKMGKVQLEANLCENDLGSLWHRLATTATAFAQVTKQQSMREEAR